MSELLDNFSEFTDFFDHVAAPTAQVPTPERVPGYVSAPRKKDGRWTEEEHRLFLLGLDRCSGKRKWKQISQQYVVSRTSIQVASHAQKHFIGNGIPLKERRRRSINDTTLKDMDTNVTPHMNQPNLVPTLISNFAFRSHEMQQIQNMPQQSNSYNPSHQMSGLIYSNWGHHPNELDLAV